MYLILAFFLIIFEMVYEGLALKGSKRLSGMIEFIYRAVITIIVFAWLYGIYPHWLHTNASFFIKIGGYLLLRFAIADGIYNLFIGEPFFFIGSTKLYDIFWKWFFKVTGFPASHFLAMLKLISILIGITWLLKK